MHGVGEVSVPVWTGEGEAESVPHAQDPLRTGSCSTGPGTVSPERPAAAFSAISNVRGTAVEDAFVLQDDLLLDPMHPGLTSAVPLFAVYDGHGGGTAANLCARRLHQFVAEQLRSVLSSGGASSSACPLDTPAVGDALREAFVATDRALVDSGVLDNNSGSTALVALLTPATIWLAWAGDSRAVLVRGGKAVAATSDHRPAQREDEKERIEKAGGMLLNNCGLRLMGMLATTRAIGDHDLQPYGLTPEPEVMNIPRSAEDEFLVLASDGLWDKVGPQEVACLAHSAWSRVANGALKGSGCSAEAATGSVGSVSGPCALPLTGSQQLLRETHSAPAGAPTPARTCPACKAARIAAAAMTKCARSRRSRDDTTVVVVNLQQSCRCARSWATVSAEQPQLRPTESIDSATGEGEGNNGGAGGVSSSSSSSGSGAPQSGTTGRGGGAAAASLAAAAVASTAGLSASPSSAGAQMTEAREDWRHGTPDTLARQQENARQRQQQRQQERNHQQQQSREDSEEELAVVDEEDVEEMVDEDLVHSADVDALGLAALADGLTAMSPFAVAPLPHELPSAGASVVEPRSAFMDTYGGISSGSGSGSGSSGVPLDSAVFDTLSQEMDMSLSIATAAACSGSKTVGQAGSGPSPQLPAGESASLRGPGTSAASNGNNSGGTNSSSGEIV